VGLQLVGQLGATGGGHPAADEHVHHVRGDVLQDPRVVRDQQHPDVTAGPVAVDALGHHAQRVHVEAGVGLVEHRELRLEQRQLQHLVPLLLAAGEALVHAALRERGVDLQVGHRGLDLFDPVAQLRGLATHGGGRRAQEVRHRDAGHLDRVLHGQEQPGPGALVDGQCEQVDAVQQHPRLR